MRILIFKFMKVEFGFAILSSLKNIRACE